MIKARHTRTHVWFFRKYSEFFLGRNFKSITIEGDYKDSNKSVLVISNHFSWWDGFIQLVLNEKVFKKEFHVMMLEEQLKQFMILNKAGAFSIKKQTRDIIKSLGYCTELLENNRNLVLIFPQGEIQSLYTQTFVFEKGLNLLLKNENASLIFNVNLVDYFSDKKPHLTIYYKEYVYDKNTTLRDIETSFNSFASDCRIKQKAR